MSSNTNLPNNVNAEALRSLRNEVQLQANLSQSSWTAVHSHYYVDPEKNGWRELDAAAIRWWKGPLGQREVIIKVAILVESKHLGQKHVLLPSFKPLRQAIIFDWAGGMAHAEERQKILLDVGIEGRTAYQLDQAISAGASDVMHTSPNILYPPKGEQWDAASFVEAPNSGKAPDERLEGSPIWKTRLSLQSAARALAAQQIDEDTREIAMAIRLALVGKVGADAAGRPFDLKKAFTDYLQKRPFTLTVFHPIIVVDSDLWGVNDQGLVPVQHARIHLTKLSRFPYFWFDLVHRDAAPEVLSRAQAGYDKQAEAKALVPHSPGMGLVDYEVARP